MQAPVPPKALRPTLASHRDTPSAEALELNAPTAPNLWAESVTGTSITLRWEAPNGSTWFQLEKWNGSSWAILYSGSNTSYTDTGLTNETAYYYHVAAWNGTWSPFSFNGGYITVFTTSGAYTGTQYHYTTQLTSTYNRLTIAETGVNYLFLKYVNGWQNVQYNSSRTYTDTSVARNTEYLYGAWVDTTGSGSWKPTNGNGGYVTVVSPPAVPPNLRTTGSTSNSITVAWDAVSGSPLPNTTIWYHLSLNGNEVAIVTSTSYTFTGLSPGTSYTLGVLAENYYEGRSDRRTISGSTQSGGPSISITSPANNARIGQLTKVDISYSAPSGVQSIEVQLDGATVASGTVSGSSTAYAWWTPSDSQNGPTHALRAKITDSSGAVSYSPSINVSIEVQKVIGSGGDLILAEGNEPAYGKKVSELFGYFVARSPIRVSDSPTGADDWVMINGQYNEPRSKASDNTNKRVHAGVDLQSANDCAYCPTVPDSGRKVYSVAAGTFKHYNTNYCNYGQTVSLRHDVKGPDGSTYPFQTFYAHLAQISVTNLAAGDPVSTSTLVGYSGKTAGTSGGVACATYPIHLHMEFVKADETTRSYAPALFYGNVTDSSGRPWGADTSFIIHNKPGASTNTASFTIRAVGVGYDIVASDAVTLYYSTNNGATWSTRALTNGGNYTYSFDFGSLGLSKGSAVLYYVSATSPQWDGRYLTAWRPWRNSNWGDFQPSTYPFIMYIQ